MDQGRRVQMSIPCIAVTWETLPGRPEVVIRGLSRERVGKNAIIWSSAIFRF
jgi:hypothetical protein